MKAIEAAEYSDVIRRDADLPYYKAGNGKWYCDGGEVLLNEFTCDDYVPLVPKKIYKGGDKVTFPEALNSGMCFTVGGYRHTCVWKDNEFISYVGGRWTPNNWNMSYFKKSVCTLAEDPSVPPKPKLESLPAWTRCKVKPVNNNSEWEVIKKPSGLLMHHYSGNDFEWVNVELISIYNPKTEQWEYV